MMHISLLVTLLLATVSTTPMVLGALLGQPCSNSKQCTVPHTTCFHGLCDCVPGHNKVGSTHCTGDCLATTLDVVFVLDVSGSVSGTKWALSKQFVLAVVQDFNVRVNKIKVALVTFSHIITNEFHLNTYRTKSDVMNHVAGLTNGGGSTWTMEALRHVRTQNFMPRNGDRPNVKNVIIIITDGYSSYGHSPIAEATQLKDDGATIITIGVGSWVNHADLLSMATDANHRFFIWNWSYFHSVKAQVLQLLCQV